MAWGSHVCVYYKVGSASGMDVCKTACRDRIGILTLLLSFTLPLYSFCTVWSHEIENLHAQQGRGGAPYYVGHYHFAKQVVVCIACRAKWRHRSSSVRASL